MRLSQRVITTLVTIGMLAASTVAGAQTVQRPGRGRLPQAQGPLADRGVSPVEMQRLFDAYIVMQAQQELQLTDEQYPKFLAKVRALQDVRRRGLTERATILQELRRLSQDQNLDDAQVRGRLKALADLENRTAADIKQALDGVDQVLDLRQQARFRLFEEQMERRKVELLTRVRQANRQRNQF